MRTVSPVSPIFEDRRGNGDGWLLAAVIVLITALIAVIAGTALAATEAAPEDNPTISTICTGYYEGSGSGGFLGLGGKSTAERKLKLPLDLGKYSVKKPTKAIVAIVNAQAEYGEVAGKVDKVTQERIVCPLGDGEIEITVREKH
jgi:hypothetical protein